ncbi:MAG: helix-turn-helix transcriptional regulator [Oscillospiraceae bacterium]|nr:helix-turn-helix transcriptional regulator [Candidatus Equicaccousia limihippi]
MYEDLIAKRLSKLRELKGVTAREMSLDIGQNPSYINRIENKKSMPSIQGLYYICEYLNITPGEFFTESNESPTLANELSEKMRKMSHAQLESLKSIIDGILDLK